MKEEKEAIDSAYLAAVIDSMADPVTVVKPDYRVILINEKAREIFRSDTSADTEMFCYQMSHHSDTPCSGSGHPCPMEEVRRTRKPVKVVHEHYDLEDRRRYVEITASPVYGDQGEFDGIVESQRDVTDRVLAEKRLTQYSEDLRSSNQMKDLFIDIMRHDLMNPAWFIRTAADHSMKKTNSDPALTEDLQMIDRQARRMIDMIQNASALAKVEGGGSLSFKEINLAEMMEGAVADYLPSAAERGMDIDFEAGAPLPAKANPLMYDVFSNLISNAVKYGSERSVIRVDMRAEEGGLRISVANRGEIIPEGERENIFTRFTRVDKAGVKGTGLGLAIVKKIVELHDGRVWVEDNPGGGSVFVLLIPLGV
jgi:signal transduction histidine kinase